MSSVYVTFVHPQAACLPITEKQLFLEQSVHQSCLVPIMSSAVE
ncbi:Hypothetical protein CpCP13_1595 [Corynebacterium pseudotuberculosis]|nr:Hypothetical protein CpPAT10_1560 [Corynebacterium pseudotuberculosis PAT10]AEP70793.1 Hypothetical protein Cp4202_1549 [Corynebacterium pseudotuberculosis 42/02-A]AFF22712.1 Hypothetical protein CpP54B96_1586 [Corynebacterium pseudotuberculosis P54B96]AFH52509.1 Hypothetical protein Cp267_1623 [Corynebacterium pseudotuberculosis 267]AJC14291.1 Hypothetical protein CpVD57_1589 [Corynebacterium pseudotuberculosis]